MCCLAEEQRKDWFTQRFILKGIKCDILLAGRCFRWVAGEETCRILAGWMWNTFMHSHLLFHHFLLLFVSKLSPLYYFYLFILFFFFSLIFLSLSFVISFFLFLFFNFDRVHFIFIVWTHLHWYSHRHWYIVQVLTLEENTLLLKIIDFLYFYYLFPFFGVHARGTSVGYMPICIYICEHGFG